MGTVRSYQQLIVWQRAMELVEAVYRATSDFPKHESFCLTAQVRRAAVSVPSNIAEGQGRGAGKEFGHHLRISNGSRQELETQLMIAQRLGYLTTDSLTDVLTTSAEVGRLLAGLMRSIR